jgi:hypothetical protein
MGKRCLTLATLVQLSKSRPWTGVPSTTQLINGTCEAFLKITKDYAVDPQDQMFALLGTKVHNRLSLDDVDGSSMEEDNSMITSHGISMTADLLEEEDGWVILTDYKTSGAFKVQKAVGISARLVEQQDKFYQKKTTITDPESGITITREKGDKMFKKIWEANIKKQDCDDWVKQLNYYRIGLEEKKRKENPDFKVHELRIEAIVRDGGLASAIAYGVDKKVYLIPIPEKDDKEIVDYFIMKKEALEKALADGKPASGCTDDECWSGRKCAKFCAVKEFCEYAQDRGVS